eukprot:15436939-Alexandrium_andersonii.AAC.1
MLAHRAFRSARCECFFVSRSASGCQIQCMLGRASCPIFTVAQLFGVSVARCVRAVRVPARRALAVKRSQTA